MPAKKIVIKWLIIVGVIIFLSGSFMIILYAKYIVPNYYEPLKLKEKVVERVIKETKTNIRTIEKPKLYDLRIQKDQIVVFLSYPEKHVLLDSKTEKAMIDKLVNELLDKEKNASIVTIKSGIEGKWELAEQIMTICRKRGFKYNLESFKE